MRDAKILLAEQGRLLKPIAAALFCIVLLANCAQKIFNFPELTTPPGFTQPDIDLLDYEITFAEEFGGRLDVSAWGCNTRWIAHTPWSGDFGAAAFADPGRNFPFVVQDGMLRIEARQDRGGRWRAGLLSAGNSCGGGFSQQYGYFEMRAKLPEGEGLWPAFWLIGRDRDKTGYTAEIDVIEHHGHNLNTFSSTVHLHPRETDVERIRRYNLHEVPHRYLYDYFNTYGVSIDEENIIFYFNREEIWRTETPPQHNQPFYPLVNLTLDTDFPIENTPNPSFMFVDYIRVYQKKDQAQ